MLKTTLVLSSFMALGNPLNAQQSIERVWTATLQHYLGGHIQREADITLEANRITGTGEQGNGSMVVLLGVRDSAERPFRRAWLDSLVSAQVVKVCLTNNPEDCPESTTTSFLKLRDPVFAADSLASVGIIDIALNPAACRSFAGRSFGGIMMQTVELHRGQLGWEVVGVTQEMSGTTMCGHLPPEEEAREQRLDTEDSLLRETESPVAGTYRFSISLPSGDSAVVYCRSEKLPMSPIRGWKEAETGRDHPIAGYYLMAVCAEDEPSIPDTYAEAVTSKGSLSVYFAVSASPAREGVDTTSYRGDPEAELAAWILLKNQPIAERLHNAFDDDARDPEAYYMPGWWVVHRNGRVSFEWTTQRNGARLMTVRGERISLKVLSGHAR